MLADAKLPEVHAIAKELAYAARRHAERTCQLAVRLAHSLFSERCHDTRCVRIRHQASRFRVAVIAPRGLATLPDACLDCTSATAIEVLCVSLSLPLGNREKDVAMHPTARIRGVDSLLHHDYAATGCLNPIPRAQLFAEVASEAREVGDGNARVGTGFYAFNRSHQ